MSANISPLTGVIDENMVFVEFGQYEGQTVSQVRQLDPELYQQLVQEKEQDHVAIRRNRDRSYRLYMNPLLSKANN